MILDRGVAVVGVVAEAEEEDALAEGLVDILAGGRFEERGGGITD